MRVGNRISERPGFNYLILRSSRFDPVGRIHDLEESKRIDRENEEYLLHYQIKYNRIWLEDTCLEIVLEEIMKTNASKNYQPKRRVG